MLHFTKHHPKQKLLTWTRFFLTPLHIPETMYSDRCTQGNKQHEPYGGNVIMLKLITSHLPIWKFLHINSMIPSHLPFDNEIRITKYGRKVVSIAHVMKTLQNYMPRQYKMNSKALKH
jgi:hypothetical protein